ncbi:hypothetical protein [Streptomyces sp. PSAA01]|uniref:hypothetical protein n=1 Tax=Streptomyces sp. PSAA01 TaxID=2912762 RepID=UPI001F34FB8A|nr:hypothetical protein [Streptomyces sp. PSAA01]MCG0285769.1 hypothetical protein [Streptomyces sp. PSAA01]
MHETMRDRLRSIPVFAGVGTTHFQDHDVPDNPLPLVGDWIRVAVALSCGP